MENRKKPKKKGVHPNSLANLKKGGSSGRKPIPKEVKELLESVTLEMVDKKIEMARDEDTRPELRNTIINDLLDRSLGKPVQAVDLKSEEKLKLVVKLVSDIEEVD